MNTVLDFMFNSEWGNYILGGFGASGFIAHAIALTPTDKDDKALGIVSSLLNLIGGNYFNAKNSD